MLPSSFAPASASGRSGGSQDAWRELSGLKQRVLENMPITRHLQFSLFLNATLGHLVATAPLGPNANHRQTAFGGSLSMLATVAGWAMTRLVLRAGQSNAEVVIQKSKIDYCAPVCDTLAFTCTPPSRRERDSFFEALDRWGRARLPLCCRATKDDGTGRAVTFEGSYVAISGQ